MSAHLKALDSLRPWLSQLPEQWLAEAEASHRLPGDSHLGLSFFFRDSNDYRAFLKACDLPADWCDQEIKFQQLLDIVPRHWIKLSFKEQQRVGWNRYFAFPPQKEAPLASLRLLTKTFQGDVSLVEQTVLAVEKLGESGWFFSVKTTQGQSRINLSWAAPPGLLALGLTELHQEGLLNQEVVDYHLATLKQADTPRGYLTVQPGDPAQAAVDYKQESGYLKRRRHQGAEQVTRYLPLSALPNACQ